MSRTTGKSSPEDYVAYNGGLPSPGRAGPTLGLPIEDALEFAANREEPCAVVLVLDTSGSMAGQLAQTISRPFPLDSAAGCRGAPGPYGCTISVGQSNAPPRSSAIP